ncbi:MAG: hypothetical protein WDN50_06520 [Bradyrhizobium sp.]
MAAELVRDKVAVIVAGGGNASPRAAKAATATIPIVFSAVGRPGDRRPGRKLESAGRQRYRPRLADH